MAQQTHNWMCIVLIDQMSREKKSLHDKSLKVGEQCDQIGRFLKVLGFKFSYKS